jgi:hypothetical protein
VPDRYSDTLVADVFARTKAAFNSSDELPDAEVLIGRPLDRHE